MYTVCYIQVKITIYRRAISMAIIWCIFGRILYFGLRKMYGFGECFRDHSGKMEFIYIRLIIVMLRGSIGVAIIWYILEKILFCGLGKMYRFVAYCCDNAECHKEMNFCYNMRDCVGDKNSYCVQYSREKNTFILCEKCGYILWIYILKTAKSRNVKMIQ